MQLKSVVIYHKDGERVREVKFASRALNVVPGVSETGKSALLQIVDYCLGSSTHRVSKEVALDSIGWYGVLLEIAGDTVFVARKRPDFAASASEEVVLRIGAGGVLSPQELHGAINTKTLITELSSLIGIGENSQPSAADRPGSRGVRATLRHAASYVFQPQELIASPKFLFLGQDEGKALHIRDTMPYFLGSVDEDAMQLRSRLRRQQRALKSTRNRLAVLEAPAEELSDRMDLLVSQARTAGLITDGQDADPRSMLVAAIDPAPPLSRARESASATISNLNTRRDGLGDELRELRASRRTLVEYRQLAEGYDQEAQVQHRRLVSLELLKDTAEGDLPCPICGGHGTGSTSSIRDLREELDRAFSRAVRSSHAPPQLEASIEEYDGKIAETQKELEDIDRELTLVLKESRIPVDTRDEREQRAFIRGRVASFLDEHPEPDPQEIAKLTSTADSQESEIEELEERLGSEATRTNTATALSYINEDITKMAQRLGLSYADQGVMLDPFNLTVVGRTPRGPVRLDQHDIGSGKSWVGYHVVTLLALHRFFVQQERPVPRMLLLDQPTQAFYPSEKQSRHDRNFGDLKDDDQDQVHRIFDLIRETVDDLKGALQVVILDHAEIPEDWFVAAVGENNWREGQRLVPADWF